MHSFPYQLIDLTHTLSEDSPSWSGKCGFEHIQKMDYEKDKFSFRAQQINMNAGIGTHLDAPAHCIPGGKTIAELSLQDLIAPCIVIDIHKKMHENMKLSVEDIQSFENQHGVIPTNSFVIIFTGWEQYWHDAQRYRNNYVFPSISKEAAEFLLTRDIVGLGIDTLSPDTADSDYPVHALILGAGKYIVENIANSALLPPTGSFSFALPIKTKNGVEAPMRLIALFK